MSGIELNKIAAAILLASLIAMMVGFVANILYKPILHPEPRGYSIPITQDVTSSGVEADAPINVQELMKNANAEAGKNTTKKCLMCHTFDKNGPNKVGPNLWNVVGSNKGKVENYKYSPALATLFAYKTIKTPTVVSAPISLDTTNEAPSDPSVDVKKTEKIIQDYLLNNPEVIVRAMEILQQRKKQELEATTNQYIKENLQEINNSTTSPVLGNNSGNIVIVSFYDYKCSYCKKGDKYLSQLINLDPTIKVVLKPFPILGDASYYTASIVLAVYNIDPLKFKTIHDELVEMQHITNEAVDKLLTDNGLDPVLVAEEANKEEIRNILAKNAELARNLKIQGVPAYVINGKLMPGMINLEQLQKIITDIRNQNN
ncbi:Cytochrome c like [Pseudolycoriella hygida]|uniref:Cytochrome c like n=1 Tax=Pseudolycoriella hygida TaxID=35572 RepID=A0A9Q0N725_9DIPT|nr:Cytochrome c like [Pseudolycoriella hygida]